MERGLAAPTRRMFVIWGLQGEGRCHGGVVTAFFVDTSGESPTCADKRTERVGLGRSRTRPNHTAQLSLGAGSEPAPASFPVSAPLSGASRSWVGVPGVRRSGRLKAIPTRREEPRFTASAFFLGLTGDAGRATRWPIANRYKRGDEALSRPKGLKKARQAACTSRRVFSFPPSEENAGFRPRNATRLRTPQTALVMDAHEPTQEQGLRKGTHPG